MNPFDNFPPAHTEPYTVTISEPEFDPVTPVYMDDIRGLVAKCCREAVAAEREACAKLIEEMPPNEVREIMGVPLEWMPSQEQLAAAIRARGT